MKNYLLCFLALFTALRGEEKLVVKEQMIHAVSSFDTADFFSTFSPEGEFLWEIPFRTKIQSFEERGDRLYILTRMRDGSAFFLSCFEGATGKLIWEKGIFAPPPKTD